MTLPATYDRAVEIHGVPFAREEISWFRHNKLAVLGAPFNWLDKADAHAQAIEALKVVAMRDTPSMMAVVDYAKQGWDLAQKSAEKHFERIRQLRCAAAHLSAGVSHGSC